MNDGFCPCDNITCTKHTRSRRHVILIDRQEPVTDVKPELKLLDSQENAD